jgi:dTDP-4-amino-4,6-dideoxygalactose transaminase
MNYRMTELQGAVALAQVRKLEELIKRRRANGDLLSSLIKEVKGVTPQRVLKGCKHSYWFYAFVVDPEAKIDASRFAQALSREGIPCSAGYIGKPIFLCQEALRTKQVYGKSHFPFDHPDARKDIEYKEGVCPVAEDILKRIVLLPLNEFWKEEDVKDAAEGIRKVARALCR